MRFIFKLMGGGPCLYPALVLLPVIFIVFIGVGFTRNDIIEDEVYNIWASEDSDFYKDRQYARDIGAESGASNMLALATTRDEGNLFTAERLEQLRARMEATETVKVEYKGNTFTWQDICASNNIGLGTVYEFPCVRLSAIDFFQEASWFFTEKDRVSWYNEGIKKRVVVPRIGRFGAMSSNCAGDETNPGPCALLMATRIANDEALNLFSDLDAMEMNNPCRVCIEDSYEQTIVDLKAAGQGLFGFMAQQLVRTLSDVNTSLDPTKIEQISGVLNNVMKILGKLNGKSIEEFLMYYTARGLYGQLGAAAYIQNYPLPLGNIADRGDPATIAYSDLLNHADAPFSSENTAGFPYPIPGVGPFGGSGIDLGGTLLSSLAYFDLQTLSTDPGNWNPLFGVAGFADPTDPLWATYVGTDPFYTWFMAGETEMTAHCGNEIDSSKFMFTAWCTKFSEPFLTDETRTVQHFAKMWYDLLVDSDGFLGLTQGKSDPYSWTNGEGCQYTLTGERANYFNQTESSILKAASDYLYFIDEGVSVGALEKKLLMGGTVPSLESGKTLEKVTAIQNIYPALVPEKIVERVKNFNRPDGPINISEEDAEAVLEKFKQLMVETWSSGWDDKEDGDLLFSAFFDSVGAMGTFTQVLRDISDDSAALTLVSIALIAGLSILFLASCNPVQSRVGITLVGVFIVLLSFLGAIGFGILVGIKININIAWTLPFIMIGLGVDDMYIVLETMESRASNSDEDFVTAMKDIFVPVTMTSFVNLSMFFILYLVTDIGGIYDTALAALIAVIFLWVSIVFCYPAYCYLDIKRQAANRYDVLMCSKTSSEEDYDASKSHTYFLFKGYKRLFLGQNALSYLMQLFVVLVTIAFFAVGWYGISQREVGVGLKEFFPRTHQASRWAEYRSDDLASWPIGMSWGRVDYTDHEQQLRMMKQFEEVGETKHVNIVDTDKLWIAQFNLWTTRHCDVNFDRPDPDVKECGRDQIYYGDAADNNTSCDGSWVENTIGLKIKTITPVPPPADNVCSPLKGGICRPSEEMFPEDLAEAGGAFGDGKTYCPVFKGWSEDKLKFCVQKWRELIGINGGLLVKEGTATPYVEDGVEREGEFNRDAEIISPIPLSTSPTMYATELYDHKTTVLMIEETRAICDQDEGTHCFLTGIPFDFWEQYINIDQVLLRLCGAALGVGFGAATFFLFLMLDPANPDFSVGKKLIASLFGGLLIAITILLCLIPVIGISLLASVSLTAFSNMAFVLSVGFATEYSVHVVHRFLSAPTAIKSPTQRVEYTMKFLAQPLTLSFLSSTIGVACLSFTDFDFNERFFFRPLMVVMVVTYFIGAFFLPTMLTMLNFEFLKVGHKGEANLVHEEKKEEALESQ